MNGLPMRWRCARNGPTPLAAAAERYQVDGDTVIAVWGVESNFGRNFGKRPLAHLARHARLLRATAGLFPGRVPQHAENPRHRRHRPDRLVGSWAGAFGHTQFMPSTFLRLAVDGDGDGKRDLMDSVPDALASTANFLHKAGWRPGEPWGYEVVLPAGFDSSVSGRTNKRPLSYWNGRGVRRADGQPIAPSDAAAGLLLPAGPRGPAFLVFRNFDAIYGYNAAESYALAIAHLADRIKGGKAFVTPWPTDDPGLSRRERRELQTLLAGAWPPDRRNRRHDRRQLAAGDPGRTEAPRHDRRRPSRTEAAAPPCGLCRPRRIAPCHGPLRMPLPRTKGKSVSMPRNCVQGCTSVCRCPGSSTSSCSTPSSSRMKNRHG
jgi:lytic murein transglycosylase